ncbi:ectoine/hydroxyectoine ABC transporter permease subunit EhuD [Streptomyces sp. 2P-4]|uniref:ectoine/hydroxyectoine ABC transporter permease subunit EhuD n=1 Tax=Streptomyces sp. 2P-4 TaxID=2931974 RepID=UPI00253FFC74|nr:ectoine/hydroxyectoine ABC transporter permease subunit EhuD [Streptomyces sp. 2P-4]
MWSWDTARDGLPAVLQGFGLTLTATALGSVLALLLGLAVALLLRARTRWITLPVAAATGFIRSTPLLVQLFAVWVLVPGGDALTLGTAVLGVHYAAYTAQVYRAGIDSVPRGQWEACVALSLPRRRVWRAVVIPQAVRNVLPSLGNYVISMFKETPYLAVIAVPEMVHRANEYGSTHFAYLEAYTTAAVVFLLASCPTALLMRRLEKRLAH